MAEIINMDCLQWTQSQPDNSVDMVIGSPPYEDARTYGIGFKLKGQDWVDWAVERFMDQLRISRGLVCWVIEGKTKNYRWSATPALFMADLHRAGAHLRKPPIYQRVGIPGSGGPDWWRNDYEFCVCATNGGKLPWSDNTATGTIPKYAPGGAMSYRLTDGQRKNRNQWGGVTGGRANRKGDGSQDVHSRPSHRTGKMAEQIERQGAEDKVEAFLNGQLPQGAKLHTKNNGDGMRVQCYTPPSLANPGNIIKCKVGGGLMGSDLAHENEAPYPESLVEPFVLCFCPPGGLIYDPFSGSGTTAAVALKHGRRFVGTDVREGQVELTKRRINEVQPVMF